MRRRRHERTRRAAVDESHDESVARRVLLRRVAAGRDGERRRRRERDRPERDARAQMVRRDKRRRLFSRFFSCRRLSRGGVVRPRFVGEVQKRSTRDDRVKVDRREPRFARGDARTVARFHRLEIGARDEIAAAKTPDVPRRMCFLFFVFRRLRFRRFRVEPAQPRRQAQHVPALGHGEQLVRGRVQASREPRTIRTARLRKFLEISGKFRRRARRRGGVRRRRRGVGDARGEGEVDATGRARLTGDVGPPRDDGIFV